MLDHSPVLCVCVVCLEEVCVCVRGRGEREERVCVCV